MFGLFREKSYKQSPFFTFCPRFVFKLDPSRNLQKNYWKHQKNRDPHGYDKYEADTNKHTPTLFGEIEARIAKSDSILDLGCNCGFMLSAMKKLGYSKLIGVDICKNAIEHGKKKFDLSNVELIAGSYEEVLPKLVSDNRQFDLVYSGGSTISLVHPSFDVIKHMCAVSRKYVIMVGDDGVGVLYPRLWEYEFGRNGFMLVKLLRPANGKPLVVNRKDEQDVLKVYQRIKDVDNIIKR